MYSAKAAHPPFTRSHPRHIPNDKFIPPATSSTSHRSPSPVNLNEMIDFRSSLPFVINHSDVMEVLKDADLLNSVHGLNIHSKGTKLELWVPDSTKRDSLLIDGLPFGKHLCQFVPVQAEYLTLYIKNIPPQYNGREIRDLIETANGEIIDVAIQKYEYAGREYRLGERHYRIKNDGTFRGLPQVIKLFGGRMMSVRYRGQSYHTTPPTNTLHEPTQHPVPSPPTLNPDTNWQTVGTKGRTYPTAQSSFDFTTPTDDSNLFRPKDSKRYKTDLQQSNEMERDRRLRARKRADDAQRQAIAECAQMRTEKAEAAAQIAKVHQRTFAREQREARNLAKKNAAQDQEGREFASLWTATHTPTDVTTEAAPTSDDPPEHHPPSSLTATPSASLTAPLDTEPLFSPDTHHSLGNAETALSTPSPQPCTDFIIVTQSPHDTRALSPSHEPPFTHTDTSHDTVEDGEIVEDTLPDLPIEPTLLLTESQLLPGDPDTSILTPAVTTITTLHPPSASDDAITFLSDDDSTPTHERPFPAPPDPLDASDRKRPANATNQNINTEDENPPPTKRGGAPFPQPPPTDAPDLTLWLGRAQKYSTKFREKCAAQRSGFNAHSLLLWLYVHDFHLPTAPETDDRTLLAYILHRSFGRYVEENFQHASPSGLADMVRPYIDDWQIFDRLPIDEMYTVGGQLLSDFNDRAKFLAEAADPKDWY